MYILFYIILYYVILYYVMLYSYIHTFSGERFSKYKELAN